MATMSPVGTSAGAASGAPASPPPAQGAAQGAPQDTSSSTAQSLTRLLGDGAPVAEVADAGAAGAAAPDPLDAFLGTLAEDDPLRKTIHGLRSNAGRVSTLQKQLNDLQAQGSTGSDDRRTAALMVDLALRGENPYGVALRYGLSPEDTQAYLETVAQARAAGGAPAGAGTEGAAPYRPGSVTPQQFFVGLRALADPSQEGSWAKPYYDSQVEIASVQDALAAAMADLQLLQADGSIAPQERATRTAALQATLAREKGALAAAHRKGLDAIVDMLGRAVAWTHRDLLGQVKPLIDAYARAEQQAQAEQVATREQQAVYQQIVTAATEDGAAEFGPNGYGLIAFDAQGNPQVDPRTGQPLLSESGKKHWPHISATMAELGLPFTMASIRTAIEVYTVRKATEQGLLAPSDGGASATAGVTRVGGDATALSAVSAPASGVVRPSQQGRGAGAPAQVPMY